MIIASSSLTKSNGAKLFIGLLRHKIVFKRYLADCMSNSDSEEIYSDFLQKVCLKRKDDFFLSFFIDRYS